ncbi:M20/M25/M40 family metallo-hydrolase [Nocardia huaxiensis]|uniref:M20/M25/M40 family metallo-hydrolase n=1 Tax=Nocardia huaxiensis TaxID=2755382 RepID=A0A7D6Z361_9NOCA|nr:M20/M25/M40 family metallo-hydrolase [Nocardia huaxiensis]QLY31706.1 M20/M25/M40 family metallo-hydrolase [Nocardia huaxiensis]
MRVGREISGLLAFALLLVVVLATAWEQQPHGYRDDSAPGDVFSAARAYRTIEEIAQRPHAVGTAEHDRVRDHLVGELRKLGLETEIRSGIGRWPESMKRAEVGIGRADNIVARIPGTAPTGTVYLAAHYDSVPSAPGANDDGAGVAAILETARVLRESETGLRNNVVLLLTDAEEPGLLGADAFVAAGDYDRDGGVVVNLEARGAGGPPLLWRLTRPDGDLVRTVAQAVPRPNTDSLTTALAGDQTSSNTDFAAFEPGGLRVLDWAFVGESVYYHNRLDDPAHVNLATLQQLGDNTVAQARDFGERDLRALDDPADKAYFTLPFGVLVVVAPWVMIALAVLALALVAWIVWQVRRAGETSIRRVLLAAATAFVAVPLAMAVVYGWWWLVGRIRPEFAAAPVDPYDPEFYQAAVIVLSVAVLAFWWVFARRMFGPTAAGVGLLTCVTVVGALFAAVAPAASVLLMVPAFAAAAAVALTFVTPESLRLPVLTVFLLPAALFLGGSLWSGVQAGLTSAPFLAAPLLVLLGGLLMLTLTHAWPQRRGWAIPVAGLVLTLVLTATGLALYKVDAAHPRLSQLIYALDADRREAQWLSTQQPDDWTRNFVSGTAPGGVFAELWPKAVSSEPTGAQSISAPVAEILSDTTENGKRKVTLRVRSTRAATRIDLRWGDAPVESLRVAGREITLSETAGFRFFAPPAEGVDVELIVPAGPLPLRLTDYSWLPDSGVETYPPTPEDTYLRQDSACAVTVTVPGLQ